MSNSIATITVALDARTYSIYIGAGLLSDASRWRAAIPGLHVLIVTNEVIAPLYLECVRQGLNGLIHDTVILPDGEQYKTLDSVTRIFDALAAMSANRDATIIALGGGVIGDTAGFAAACWMRGIAYLQMPTTLLAQVDSSVGGKTAVNLSAGKNLVGAFHQPSAVVIDIDTLTTLPDREYRAGLAEVVKYAAIGDAQFFTWLEAHIDAINKRDVVALTHLIATSCQHKVMIVTDDEREQGKRMLLNFGHTFGHALEAGAGYGTLLHGEAVAIGMVLAARLSTLLGLAPAADALRLQDLLGKFNLPTILAERIDPGLLLTSMRLDKKARSGQLRLVLWHGIGHALVVRDIDEALIRKILIT